MRKQMPKRSRIWTIPKEDLTNLVNRCNTFTAVLAFFGLRHQGGNCRTLKARLAADNISYQHIVDNISVQRKMLSTFTYRPLAECLVENFVGNRTHVKDKILKAGLLENKCVLCGIGPTWAGNKLVMILDHINGVNNDYRIENLRLVCPNCASQLPTFVGRNNKKGSNLLHRPTGRSAPFEGVFLGSNPSGATTTNCTTHVVDKPI